MKKAIGAPQAPFPLHDWGQLQLICPCSEGTENRTDGFIMVQEGHNIKYYCKNPECHNQFDSLVKFRIFERLEKYYKTHNSFQNFSCIIESNREKIRIRYIEEYQLTETFLVLVLQITNTQLIHKKA